MNKTNFLLLTLFIFGYIINASWSYYLTTSKSNLKQKRKFDDDIIIELSSDDEETENEEEIFSSEMIPIKFWTDEKKDELQNQINDYIDISEVDTSANFSFYNQLNSLEKKYYDIIYNNSIKTPPNLTIKFSITTDTSNTKKFSSELVLSAEKVFTAIVYENPQLWWLGTYQIKLSYTNTKYTITFITVPSNSKFSVYSKEEISDINMEIEDVKKLIIKEINKLHFTTNYAIIKYIHDFLIVKNVYTLDENLLHIRTIYGSLIDNKCVCEGYAEAFQYLAQQYNINCIIGRSSTHEWNYVEMDGKWYAVDVTFDDKSSKNVKPMHNTYDNLQTEYFLVGNDHIGYSKKKFSEETEHILIYSGYSNENIISYPYIETNDYVPSEIELEEIKLINLFNIASFTTTRKISITTTTTKKSTTTTPKTTTTTTKKSITTTKKTTTTTTKKSTTTTKKTTTTTKKSTTTTKKTTTTTTKKSKTTTKKLLLPLKNQQLQPLLPQNQQLQLQQLQPLLPQNQQLQLLQLLLQLQPLLPQNQQLQLLQLLLQLQPPLLLYQLLCLLLQHQIL
ncbi:hypothetical protein PIROE2DRAFT_7253 [Piromyces sp. E2]|nr:hypothetical protein PIROE2DRAFT_7253 [Piromyces sp. E2]|eukprot:OUM65671.1 hypothetical protein PIROE2DRAFT_7253 [Piromyces sp. E2]